MATPVGSHDTPTDEHDRADAPGAGNDATTQRARRRQRREHHHEQDRHDDPAGKVEFEAPPEHPTEEELRREEEQLDEARERPEGFVSLGEESDDASDHGTHGQPGERHLASHSRKR
ncbi:hypothetical protein Pmar_PMAR016666 [Perkinsus marinus ATCC 50983]|uniref:Uncharacterized protein n=1 Tax=Perkinsus marinus (strain ATCC 50983 / TXsc) TaxID=423536 RepID=C5KNX6_PERM5|nr:hypothetical protein Pmar_PMAR016666 [Perkinsus marinus ATCC 50983]EER13817.1 hypothetical protein Pmar_PMAR016666 [Perkinsus marinus ATCC 50983]|eukprot:XP_002782022.1 hypothetical protein Pmar_PMAR016666 [Perkinsus marinus ATCC 50983]